jgi:hypothetical protein
MRLAFALAAFLAVTTYLGYKLLGPSLRKGKRGPTAAETAARAPGGHKGARA